METRKNILWVGTMVVTLAYASASFAQYKEQNSWLIDFNSPSPASTPTLELWVDQKNKRPNQWRLMSQGQGGKLLAEMIEPPLPKGYVYNYGECWYHNKQRNDVIAQVKHGKAAKSKVIANIWQADPVSKTFRLLTSSQGFECDNVGYGV